MISVCVCVYTRVCVCLCVCVCVCVCIQSLRCVWLSGTLWKLSPGSSVHGIFQARILELVAISYSRKITINLCIILVNIFLSIILSFIIFSVNVSHSFWFLLFKCQNHTKASQENKITNWYPSWTDKQTKNPSKSNPSICKNNNTSEASGVILRFKSW